MKKNKDKRIKGQFITVILGKYVIFSIILVALMLGVIFGAVYTVGTYSRVPHIDRLAKQFSRTSVDDYSSIDVERIIGAGSYIQVLDSNYNLVYSSSDKNNKAVYGKDELKFIPDYKYYSLVSVDCYNDKARGEITVVSTMFTDDDGKDIKDAVYIVDKNLNVLYTSDSSSKKKLSEREYKFLTNDISKHYNLSKCELKDADGNKRIVLAFSRKGLKTLVQQTAFKIVICFILIYILLLVLFSVWVALRLKKPLKMLNNAMSDVKERRWIRLPEYSGPKEFVEICDAFNEMTEALRESENENQRLEREKQKMIADISHDLKTPITVITGYSKAICDGVVLPGDEKKYLKIINQKAEYLTELINDFHEYSKLDHPENTFDFQDVDICEYTREFFADKYDEFDINGYNIEVSIPEEKYIVRLDRKTFARVYENITSNFFRYCQPGCTLFCTIRSEEDSVRIKIGDNGNGIPEEIRHSLFDAFVVGERSRSKGGSGLGLALSKKITEGHGGTIRLNENPSEGLSTEYIIILDKKSI